MDRKWLGQGCIISLLIILALVVSGCTAKQQGFKISGENIYDTLKLQQVKSINIFIQPKTLENYDAKKQLRTVNDPETIQKIVREIKEKDSSLITIKQNTLDVIEPVTHQISFLDEYSYPLGSCEYSLKNNQILFAFSQMFPKTRPTDPLYRKAIIMDMDEDFPNVMEGIL